MPMIALWVLKLFGINISGWLGRLIEIGVVIVAIFAAWTAFAWHYESKGAEKTITKYEDRNKEAIHAADIVRKGFDNMCGSTALQPDCLQHDEWTIDVPGGVPPVPPDPQLPRNPPTRSR